ncbi:MAG: DUF2062 domain-containing protein [Bdellovibrionales bacterium]|jgi:uncharacterized protein (DUF2062 family)|nr:DUF2062 domain-containing protein [Bdellovibrionales bacterium]
MFKRRKPQSFQQKMRNFFWPLMGWRRLGRYYMHRVGRLAGTPYFIAAGFANGIAISLTPFLGFHLLLGAFLCWMTRSGVVAMVIGTALAGNPWTFSLIWVVTYRTGHWLMGNAEMLREARAMGVSPVPQDISLKLLIESPMELLVPMTIGCMPYVLPVWLLSFYGVRKLVMSYRRTKPVPAVEEGRVL